METGYFNTEHPETIRVFNRPCSLEKWENAVKPQLLYFLLTEWIAEENMSSAEKYDHPEYKAAGGYLRKYSYKEAFRRSWEKASPKDRELVTELPNFDPDIFYEISGIRVEDKTGEEIVIDGITYKLVKK